MAWLIEDWGTALGTTGNGAWAICTIDGFGTAKVWGVNGTALLSSTVSSAGTGANIYGGAPQAWTGGQRHSFLITANQPLRFESKLAEYDGTSIYLRTYRSTGASGSLVIARCIADGAAWSELSTIATGAWASGSMSCTYAGGTWTGTLVNVTTGSTYTLAYGAGVSYAPSSAINPVISFHQGNPGLQVRESAWEYTPPDTILRFLGTWATGSGTYNWGGDLLGFPSDVQDRAYGPVDRTGWASTVRVTLDDSTGQWGSFAGTSTLPFEGTWQLRQFWGTAGDLGATLGSWTDLLTGFVEPDGLTYDYGRKQAHLTIQSSIARAAQKVAAVDGTTANWPCYQTLLGTITYADADSGTVRIGNHPATWQAEAGCFLWGTTGTATTSVKIGSTITETGPSTYGGTGTIVVDGEFPDWLAVGNEVWITLPWPSYSWRDHTQILSYVLYLCDSMGLAWPTDNRQVFNKQVANSNISPNDRMYGGEKLVDALSGIMGAVNGFYSVDPSGSFRANCLMPRYSVSGTIQFGSAYDSDWSFAYEPAYSRVEVDCSYNVLAGSFTEHVTVGGTQPWGEVKEYELKWLGSGIEAQSMAGRLYRNSYLPRPALRLRVPGYLWGSFIPGNPYAVHGLPAAVLTQLSGTQMLLYSREYSYADDLTALELVSMPGGNYAVWDGTPADYWEGSGKVWY